MPVNTVRELRHGLFVIFHVPHGERAVVHASLEASSRGRSPFLAKACNPFQDTVTDIEARWSQTP